MIPDNIKFIMEILHMHNFEAYIVGGAVRDYIIGVKPHDYDIFTNATGEKLLEILPGSKVIGGEERQAKILTVIYDGVEISQFRKSGDRTETGNNLKEHINTCDFTMNAIAMDIDENIIDMVDGKTDIKNKTIRFVGNPEERIKEDKLRILRAVRFNVKYGFSYERDTSLAITAHGKELFGLPMERIRDELMKILQYKTCLGKLGWVLQLILPELYALKNIPGGHYHIEDNFTHAKLTFETACDLTNNILLCFTGLIHDIGKSITFDEGHFYEHEHVGAKLAKEIMQKLKFSNEEIEYVFTLIDQHMWKKTDDISKKSYIKHFAALDKANVPIEDYVLLLYCDNQANLKNPRIKYADFIRSTDLIDKYYSLKAAKEPFKVSDLEVSGKDLMVLGYKPSPEIGRILSEVFEAVLLCQVENEKIKLIQYIKDNYIDGPRKGE